MNANLTADTNVTAPVNYRARSNKVFVGLLLVSGLLAMLSVYLPQGEVVPEAYANQNPAPQPVMALVAFAVVVVLYGGIGALGLLLARKLGLPDLIDPAVSNRQRYLVPMLVGLVLGLFIIAADLIFAPINGVGRLIHPPFPTSLVASYTAGFNEEVLFRLFYISFFTWLIARVLLRGRAQGPVFWVVSVFAALAFGASHLPAVMYLIGATSIEAIPAVLLAEIFLLNGVMGMACAYLFKRSGFLAAAGAHFWADIAWHVVWGLLG